MKPLVHELEELLHEGRDGRRGVGFLHRWWGALVFNRCCLGGAAPLAVCRYRWSGVAAPTANPKVDAATATNARGPAGLDRKPPGVEK